MKQSFGSAWQHFSCVLQAAWFILSTIIPKNCLKPYYGGLRQIGFILMTQLKAQNARPLPLQCRH